MIVKYLSNGVWGYIDNVRQVGNREYNFDDAVHKYDHDERYRDDTHSGENDIASYMNGEKLSKDIANINKAFLVITESLKDTLEDENSHYENLILPVINGEYYQVNCVLLYLNNHKEYDTLIFVTNQKCYLMNDEGKTIERLV